MLTAKAQCPLDIGQVTVPPSGNLLQYFPFDGTLTNYGSSGQIATNSGATFVPTQCGQGLSFDGIDDFVLVSPNINLTNNFTITSWIKPNALVDWMGIFSIREQCATNYRGYSMVEFGLENYNVPGISQQINQHQNCTGWSGGDRYTDPAITIPNGQESFVAVSVQNNSSEGRIVKLYLNCQEYSTSMTLDWSSNVSFSNTINYLTTIGATSSVSGQTNTFDGIIDEVRVYDAVLNHDQILDIYQSCLPVYIDVINNSDCSGDSAIITLYNSEPDVDYQLWDITNSIAVGPIQPGNCSPLVFPTGIVTDTIQFQVVATNTTSNCSLSLDSVITLFPTTNNLFYDSLSLNPCSGDSVLINNQYVYSDGTYNDTISLGMFCDSIITYDLAFIPSLNLNIGADTTICAGDSIVLVSNINGNSYLWDNGSLDSFLVINQSGTYWLEVTDNCNTYIDTITISYIDGNFDLGNDTSICAGDSILLNAFTPSATYLWNNGSITSSIWAGSSGTYWVEVHLNTCVFYDSILILDTISPPIFDLGLDTTICEGNSVELISNLQNAQLLWSTGDTSNFLIVDQLGQYWLEATNSCGTSIDTVFVDVESPPIVNLGQDVSLCTGDSLLLELDSIPSGYSVIWSNGSSDNDLIVDQAGLYHVIVYSNYCSNSDSIYIDEIPSPIVQLGEDVTICNGSQYLISASGNIGAYLWNTGSYEESIIVNASDVYTVTLSNECGSASDSIIVSTEECWCTLYIPNTFSPDGDEFNQQFLIKHDCIFNNYHIQIFNRWGESIWESYDPDSAWDATYLGKSVPSGTYTYSVVYSSVDGETKVISGHVNVLR